MLEKDQVIEQRDQAIDQKDQHITLLKEIVRLKTLARFATKSEKCNSEQRELFNEAELTEEGESLMADLEEQDKGRKPQANESNKIRS